MPSFVGHLAFKVKKFRLYLSEFCLHNSFVHKMRFGLIYINILASIIQCQEIMLEMVLVRVCMASGDKVSCTLLES